MDHKNVQSSQNMNLLLSTDAKPRLKWTPELHQMFIDAVDKLGGSDKATPKSLMRMMGIPGLTLYHLKSHLQKYRLGKQQESEMCNESKAKNSVDCEDHSYCSLNELNFFSEGNESNQEQIQENVHVTQAIQLQMEVQRKLHEQIEVQRHLQLRIEAQGKYLQKVLKKAHETISIYNASEIGAEHAKAELSQLVTMVSKSNSSFSELTEITDLSLDNLDQKGAMRNTGCSIDSSLTSSERPDDEERDTAKFNQETSRNVLPLLDMFESRGLSSRKRSRSTTSEGICVHKKVGILGSFDLNNQSEHDLNLGPNKPIIIDLDLKL